MSWKTTVVICCLILLLGAGITAVIFSTEPTATRVTATKETAMLVEVSEVSRGRYRPSIVAMGTVTPVRDIVLSPRVGGEVVERAPAFTPGGFVEKGATLLRIDPADYENALEQEQSDLQQAVADLNLELGRQNVAERDYELFDGELTGESRALVLRQPQLRTARARVAAARAAVAQAELELDRTRIGAPFDAHILSREVNVGSQVAPGDRLGRLVGLGEYWVVTTVPVSKLRWISFPDGAGEKGSQVRVRNQSAWPEGAYRIGHIDGLVGALEEQTRLARVLVTVPDPLGRESAGRSLPSLMIGAFVEARIQAEEIADVVRVDRDHVRKDDTIWLMDDERQLRVRKVEIVFRDAEHAYVASGLEDGDRVVETNLSVVTDGARLRLAGDGPGEGDSTDDDARAEGGA